MYVCAKRNRAGMQHSSVVVRHAMRHINTRMCTIRHASCARALCAWHIKHQALLAHVEHTRVREMVEALARLDARASHLRLSPARSLLMRHLCKGGPHQHAAIHPRIHRESTSARSKAAGHEGG